MNFNETLPFLFAQISTYYKVEIEKQLNEFNLHAGQIFILFELWKTDGLSQIELSANLRLSPPTINKMVKSLMSNGFIVTSACPRDGRVVRVYLTPKGAAIRPQVEEKWRKIEDGLVANLTATEQLVLSQLFGKLVENLLSAKASDS
ncbi:MAG TPA: MarR family transcriptional regulator [Pyrinomonadaceae bacterium]|nr:MarR family transcriptional regulator [Pyrinomonadaceae bacterium]